MTGEVKKATLVAVMAVSIIAWLGCVLAAVWHMQHDALSWGIFWAIVSVAPMAVVYEILRRWNRG